MVDTYVSDAYAARCEGSSPFLGTKENQTTHAKAWVFVFFVSIKLMGLEAVATLSTEEIGKYALNGIFCCKEFLEASIRLKIGTTLREKSPFLGTNR